MPDTVFLDALQKITASQLALRDLIEAAATLNGAGQAPLSRQLYRLWIRLNPEDPHLHVAQFNCAVLESDAGELAGAGELLKAAIDANPDFFPAYINLGGVLERGGAAEQGVETWKAMLGRVAPLTGNAVEMKVTALKQIGRVFSDHHKPAMAELALRESLDLVPNQRDVIEQYVALRMSQCEWPVMAPPSERVDRKTLMMGISPLSASGYADDPIFHLGTAVRFVEQSTPDPEVNPSDRRDAAIDLTGRRLRVGYLSSDLRDHAIGYLMAEVFELHDRNQVEVFAYYCGRKDDGALNARIKASVEHWCDIREMDDDAAAAQIAADAIDILVDVNGHTRDGRAGVFARRPAPILVNWLGYPGTMGSPYHHYVIADDWIIPPAAEPYYTEKVVRLPCYQPNDRKRAIAPRPTRAEVGLPEDAFVFCSFNGAQKLTRHTCERWLEIMRAVPGSVLWLLDPGAETAQRLADYAEQRGVERSRLVIAPKLANPFHLARYPLADLFLDSFPYGAHTTASDALWMGVPLLTMSGRSFASRVCGSLVRAAGLPELVCDNPQTFVQRAIELANEPATVAALKAKLEVGRATCDLFNMEKLAASLEALYAGMCADYLQGELPTPDLRNLNAYLRAAVDFDHDAQELLALAPDYDDFYRAKLAKRHQARPLVPDARLWKPAEPGPEAEPARKRRANAR